MLFTRMLRAIRLDGSLYEELRQDPVALLQALAVVLIAVLSRMAGGVLLAVTHGRGVDAAIFQSLLVMPVIWLLPAISLFFLGGLARATDADRGGNRDLLIAAGFSAAPAVFWLLLPVPYVNLAVVLITEAWLMVSMVVAAKAMLRVSITRATMFVVPGILVFLIASTLGRPSGG